MGCAVAALVVLSAKTEARPPASQGSELPARIENEEILGVSSWYGPECRGNATASGEPFDMNGLTAAHLTLPFGTKIRVTNIHNNRSLILRVNDRGPGIPGRLLDVSMAAAKHLGFLGAGLTRVRIEILGYPRNRQSRAKGA